MRTPTWWRRWLPSAMFAVVLLIIAVAGGASVWLSLLLAGLIVVGSLVAADSYGRIWREARASWRTRRRE